MPVGMRHHAWRYETPWPSSWNVMPVGMRSHARRYETSCPSSWNVMPVGMRRHVGRFAAIPHSRSALRQQRDALYVLAVYFGALGVKRTATPSPVALAAEVVAA